ncbi:hypothetical protein [Mycobacterium tuberculosis]|nr:hypothetical protein [Mycobacterium tuberculosis]
MVDARKPCRAARLRQPVEPVLAQQQPAGAAGSGAAGVGAGAAVAAVAAGADQPGAAADATGPAG